MEERWRGRFVRWMEDGWKKDEEGWRRNLGVIKMYEGNSERN